MDICYVNDKGLKGWYVKKEEGFLGDGSLEYAKEIFCKLLESENKKAKSRNDYGRE